VSSELAELICQTYFNNTEGALLRNVIDVELAEAREVLYALASWPRVPCWCRVHHDDSNEKCQRARALYEKLLVK
jgi:hypothetical protein